MIKQAIDKVVRNENLTIEMAQAATRRTHSTFQRCLHLSFRRREFPLQSMETEAFQASAVPLMFLKR